MCDNRSTTQPKKGTTMHTTDLTEFFKGANLAHRMVERFDLGYCWPLTRQGGH